MNPAGYQRLLLEHAVAVVRSDVAANVHMALMGRATNGADGKGGNGESGGSTLLDYAAQHAGARLLRGRGAAYAVTLPESELRVVVRHNRHGGLLAPITGDYFFTPTRAPRELELSLALRERGVPTPEIVAYALYPPGGLIQRADVCSSEIPASRDFADIVLRDRGDERQRAFEATAELIVRMSRLGVRHHDLNAKNILVAGGSAFVIDVDRVSLRESPARALDGNLGRLVRSLRKWREEFGAPVTEPELAYLERETRQRTA